MTPFEFDNAQKLTNTARRFHPTAFRSFIDVAAKFRAGPLVCGGSAAARIGSATLFTAAISRNSRRGRHREVFSLRKLQSVSQKERTPDPNGPRAAPQRGARPEITSTENIHAPPEETSPKMKRKNPLALMAGWLGLLVTPLQAATGPRQSGAAQAPGQGGTLSGRVMNQATSTYLDGVRATAQHHSAGRRGGLPV